MSVSKYAVVFDYTKTTAYEKGEAGGEARGEAKAKKEDSFGMFAEGLSIEAIVRITKLPLDTIQDWKQEWEKVTK